MGSIVNWWLSLWVLAGMLLPGLDAWRLCGCDGSWSLCACACEQPAAEPARGCCSTSDEPPVTEKAPRIASDGRSPCTGCVLITTSEPPPQVTPGEAPAPFFASSYAIDAPGRAEAPRKEPRARISRGRD